MAITRQLAVGNKYEVITAVASMTPELTDTLTLTAHIGDIRKAKIKSFSVTDAVSGVNQVNTVTCATCVVGTTYAITITSAEQTGGVRFMKTYTFEAKVTTDTALGAAFRTELQRDAGKVPWTVTGATTDIIITATPTGITGEAPFVVSVSDTGILSDVATTPNTDPIGDGTQLLRLKNQIDSSVHSSPAYSNFKGTPVAGSAYTTVVVEYENDNDKMVTDTLYIVETATYITYMRSVVRQYLAQLKFGQGVPVACVAIAGTGIVSDKIPAGALEITTTSGNANYLIHVPADQPVGTVHRVITDATGFKIDFPTGEAMNGGVAAGTAAVKASMVLTLKKDSTTNWSGHIQNLDGTAPDSTDDDQAATS